MRVTTLLRQLVGVMQMFVTGVRLNDGELLVDVRPRWRRPRCGECGAVAPGYDRSSVRQWRALAYGRVVVRLLYAPRRVKCRDCGGVRVEKVPWAAHGSWFTYGFEEYAAYLAQVCDRTTASRLLGVSWSTVGNIVERVVSARLDEGRLAELKRIGIDEFSYKKRHRYVTTVVDHDTRRVVWASKGHGAETLEEFFDQIGPESVARLEMVTLDMAGGYLKALKARAPHVEKVFDRFHVAALASTAVDEVRREVWRSVKGTDDAKAIKGARYALLKSPWNLTRKEARKLATIQSTNKRLYRAYLLKETLAAVFDHKKPSDARHALDEWLAWAGRSKLAPFAKLARTIRKHRVGILAYVKHRMTNAIVEGFNNRMRAVTRRAYGFHSASSLIAMLFLCVGGITLDPPLPGTHST